MYAQHASPTAHCAHLFFITEVLDCLVVFIGNNTCYIILWDILSMYSGWWLLLDIHIKMA